MFFPKSSSVFRFSWFKFLLHSKKIHPGGIHPKRIQKVEPLCDFPLNKRNVAESPNTFSSSAPSSQRLLDQCPTGQHRRGGVRLRKALHLLLREPALPRQLGQTAGILPGGYSQRKNDSRMVKTMSKHTWKCPKMGVPTKSSKCSWEFPL